LLRISSPIVVVAVALAGVLSTAVDLRTRRIPNVLTCLTAAGGLAIAATGFGPQSVGSACTGLLVAFVVMLPGHVIGATGAGDVKLFAALGTLLGPKGALCAFLYTALAGGLIAVVVAWRRRLLQDTISRTASLMQGSGATLAAIESVGVNRFAYAPAIAVGTFAAALGL
jgi:prepilin peptidase CpaA